MLSSRFRGPGGIVTVLALCAVAGVYGAAQVDRAAEDRALAAAVTTFLDRWLVQRSAPEALAQHLSPMLTDERFLPQPLPGGPADRERLSLQWMNAPHPMSPEAFQKGMSGYLNAVARIVRQPVPALSVVLLPFSMAIVRETDEELADILAPLEPRQLPDLPAIAYQVRGWRDIQWTASGTVGYRTSLAAVIQQQKLDVQAVLSRMRPVMDNREPKLFVMLWANRPGVAREWKLLGLDVAPEH